MEEIHVNLAAVLVAAIVTFILGGLWYTRSLFGNPWMKLVGKSEDELRKGARPTNYVIAFISGLITAYVLALIVGYAGSTTVWGGAGIGALCWLGFAGATSYLHNLFAGRPARLWAIDSGYSLVCFILAGVILAIWR